MEQLDKMQTTKGDFIYHTNVTLCVRVHLNNETCHRVCARLLFANDSAMCLIIFVCELHRVIQG